jgi:DNA-binding HxlR family transcriptional regulator
VSGSEVPAALFTEVSIDIHVHFRLLVLRDLMFAGKRHFRELLQSSDERTASNILADRLARLVEHGLRV